MVPLMICEALSVTDPMYIRVVFSEIQVSDVVSVGKSLTIVTYTRIVLFSWSAANVSVCASNEYDLPMIITGVVPVNTIPMPLYATASAVELNAPN
ncbi:hypothetical protein D3C71_1533470 [compost metagenome]